MKKTIGFILLLIGFLGACNAQDSLFLGTFRLDTLQDQPIECYPYQCSTEVSRTYAIAQPFAGFVAISANMPIEVLIMSLDWVHWDTCLSLTSWAMSERIGFQYPLGTKIVVNSQQGGVVNIFCKDDAAVTRLIPQPFLSIDTLCPMTAIEPLEPPKPLPRQLWEFDGYHWRQVAEMRPNRLYKTF